MGKIIRNNIEYTGSSNSAGNISYDNTTSELQSQTVQNAITELKDLVDENAGNDVGRFEKDNQGNITGEIFNTYTGNYKNVASGQHSHAEGYNTTASGTNSHAEGYSTKASGEASHAEGSETKASGDSSHAEGKFTKASGSHSHAEGYETTASGYRSHAEGISTIASGSYSHAEGVSTSASGAVSHAEGYNTAAIGDNSHAEGNHTFAYSANSHAEGNTTEAVGENSHAGGLGSIAITDNSTVIGKYNIADTVGGGGGDSSDSDSDSSDSDPPTPSSPPHLFIIGNGTDSSHRSNIVEVTSDTLNVNGDITVAGKPLVVQCDTMSTADEYLLGRIVQYVGATDANYTHGWFYECVSDGEEPPTYSWKALMDSVPTSGSKNPVTSNGVFWRTPLVRSGINSTSAYGGEASTASGRDCFAYGYYTSAGASNVGYACAFGYNNQAKYDYLFACGRTNSPKNGDLFEIGNGSGSSRSNIVEVNATSMNINGDIKKNNVSLPTPYTTMPTVTASMVGQIAMYVGTTDANYTKGWFYEAKSDGAAEPTYYWAKIGDGRTETILWENTGTTNPDTITLSEAYTNFDELVIVHANDRPAFSETIIHTSTIAIGTIYVLWLYSGTIYATYAATSSTVFTKTSAAGVYTIQKIIGIKYGSNGGNTDDYSTAERKIGTWIDGSDLYQRTFVVTGLVNQQANNAVLGTSGIDIKDVDGYIEWTLNGEPSPRTSLNYSSSSTYYVVTQIAYTDINIQPNRANTATLVFDITEAVITIKYTKLPQQANLMQAPTPTEEVSETPSVEEQEEVPKTPIEDDMR